MAVPLQAYPLTTQNSRVSNLAGDNTTVRNQLPGSSAAGAEGYRSSIDGLIEQAYADAPASKSSGADLRAN